MKVTTLSLLAVCLVSGALASNPILKKETAADGTITLTCTGGGGKPFTFHKKGNPAELSGTPQNGMTIKASDGKLSFSKEKITENIREYVCMDKDKKVSQEDIKVGPTLIKVTEASGDIQLTCTGKKDYKFKKSGTEVKAVAGGPVLVVNKEPGTLTIKKDAIEKNAGSYTCVGANLVASDPVVVVLPTIPKLSLASADTKMTLTCKTDTVDKVLTYSFWNATGGSPVAVDDTPDGLDVDPRGTLEILTDKFTYYAGKYMCKAKVDAEAASEVLDVTKAESSTPRVLTSGALALCLLVTYFL